MSLLLPAATAGGELVLLLLAAAVAVALCFRLAVRERSASIRSSRVRLASLLSPPAFSFRLAERSFIGSE